uniref:Major facilitator superfamily (MFS) profile domain-containing protein n=1 Tax=Kwoniella pini CBS 10737 TaxID=1296096 RepID=A0A1B9HWM5_9TREE|nr:uncharacterized protein I206_06581 [Kwoniella pini CBS 10737]OCF47676.1 hypothetical protein I206_06581 [Kwoniella pini CBS 10737]
MSNQYTNGYGHNHNNNHEKPEIITKENKNGIRNSNDSSNQFINNNNEDQKMPDTIPNHSKIASETIFQMSPEEYALAEKKLLRKLDFKLIPWMTLLYLLSFIDRVNVGAAKLVGKF